MLLIDTNLSEWRLSELKDKTMGIVIQEGKVSSYDQNRRSLAKRIFISGIRCLNLS